VRVSSSMARSTRETCEISNVLKTHLGGGRL
jgi:hypothetical protein